MNSTCLTRRDFLRRSLVAVSALSGPWMVPSSVLARNGRAGPNDQITLGFIGLGNKGFRWQNAALVKSFIPYDRCRIIALCDVHRPRLEEAKAYVDQHYGNRDCAGYRDFREMLQRDDLDAVVITTPHHWHACMSILACEHGKDVYVEKPLSNSIRQGRAMVDAARRFARVVQTGSQARSSQKFDYTCRIIREGRIGAIRQLVIGCGHPPRRCNLPAQPVPEHLDWDLWVGPGQWHPYHEQLFEHPSGYLNFGGGGVTDWGHHFFDVAQWALGMDHSGPIEVWPADGPKREFLTFRYANGVEMILHMNAAGERLSQGTLFVGTEGRIDTMAWGDAVSFEPASLGAQYHAQIRSLASSQNLVNAHLENFLDCVRTRRKPNADVDIGRRSVNVAHLANICRWVNRPLRWDPVKEEFPGDADANRYLDIALRAPWRL